MNDVFNDLVGVLWVAVYTYILCMTSSFRWAGLGIGYLAGELIGGYVNWGLGFGLGF